jgi:hypothetical protein
MRPIYCLIFDDLSFGSGYSCLSRLAANFGVTLEYVWI